MHETITLNAEGYVIISKTNGLIRFDSRHMSEGEIFAALLTSIANYGGVILQNHPANCEDKGNCHLIEDVSKVLEALKPFAQAQKPVEVGFNRVDGKDIPTA